MSKKYYAWKNADCNGNNPEWVEMTGNEFYEFKRKPENRKRLFIELYSYDINDDVVVIEVTKEKFNEWNKENMRHIRNENEKEKWNISILSLDCEQDGGCTLYDEISTEEDIVTELIKNDEYSRLYKAINGLDDEEKLIINLLFFKGEDITERTLARKMGISFQLLNYKKQKILKKIKKVF